MCLTRGDCAALGKRDFFYSHSKVDSGYVCSVFPMSEDVPPSKPDVEADRACQLRIVE